MTILQHTKALVVFLILIINQFVSAHLFVIRDVKKNIDKIKTLNQGYLKTLHHNIPISQTLSSMKGSRNSGNRIYIFKKVLIHNFLALLFEHSKLNRK